LILIVPILRNEDVTAQGKNSMQALVITIIDMLIPENTENSLAR
jgi:hypothetical protein